jgi:Tetracyclin repressor-like, C-terminal domain
MALALVTGQLRQAVGAVVGRRRLCLGGNWASRDDLLVDAIEEQAPFPAPMSAEPAPARLEAALQEIAAALTATSWGWIFPAALAATDASPALAAGYHAFMTTLRAVFATIIAHGKKAGDLPPDLDEEEFTDTLLGPLFFRRLIRKLPADPAWIRHHLQHALAAYHASPPGPDAQAPLNGGLGS